MQKRKLTTIVNFIIHKFIIKNVYFDWKRLVEKSNTCEEFILWCLAIGTDF